MKQLSGSQRNNFLYLERNDRIPLVCITDYRFTRRIKIKLPEAILTRASSSCIRRKASFLRVSQKSSESSLFNIKDFDPVSPPCFASQPRFVDWTRVINEFFNSSSFLTSRTRFFESFNVSSNCWIPLSLSNLTWLHSSDKISSILSTAILDG